MKIRIVATVMLTMILFSIVKTFTDMSMEDARVYFLTFVWVVCIAAFIFGIYTIWEKR